jgi:hypothetical protein
MIPILSFISSSLHASLWPLRRDQGITPRSASDLPLEKGAFLSFG